MAVYPALSRLIISRINLDETIGCGSLSDGKV